MLKIGLVGLGKMGLLHASLVSVLPEARVVAVCEKNRLVRRFAKNMLRGITIVENVKEFSGLGLDGVYVTTPPGSHYPIVETIYSMGISKNVFVEKPLSMTPYESGRLCALALESGGVHMVGYHKRFSSVFRKGKELFDQGVLGKVVSFEAYVYSSDHVGVKAGFQQPRSRGGLLRELGCHCIDLALWYLGDLHVEPSNGTASPGAQASRFSSDSRVRTADGVVGEIHVSTEREGYRLPEAGLNIVGSQGSLEVNEDRLKLQLSAAERRTWYRQDFRDRPALFLLGEPDYALEDQCFLQAIRDGCSVMPNFDTAARVDEVISEIQTAGG